MIEPSIMLTVTGVDVTERLEDGNIIIQDKKGEIILQVKAGDPIEKFGIPATPFMIETAPRINLELYVNGCYSVLSVNKK